MNSAVTSMSMGRLASTSPQFGRLASSQELARAQEKAGTSSPQPLGLAYNLSLEDLNALDRMSKIKMMMTGQELVQDTLALMTQLRQQGLPKTDQPLFFMLKGKAPALTSDQAFRFDLLKTVGDAIAQLPRPFRKMADVLDLDSVQRPQRNAKGTYTRQDARNALEAVVNSPNDKPIAETLVLMDVLINRAGVGDLAQVDGKQFAFRLTLPGESVHS